MSQKLAVLTLSRRSSLSFICTGIQWTGFYMIETCHERVKTAIIYVSRGAISKAHHSKKRFSKKMVDEIGMKSEKEGGENAVKKMMSLTENIFTSKVLQLNFSLSVSH